jgi:hypothetical protein
MFFAGNIVPSEEKSGQHTLLIKEYKNLIRYEFLQWTDL